MDTERKSDGWVLGSTSARWRKGVNTNGERNEGRRRLGVQLMAASALWFFYFSNSLREEYRLDLIT